MNAGKIGAPVFADILALPGAVEAGLPKKSIKIPFFPASWSPTIPMIPPSCRACRIYFVVMPFRTTFEPFDSLSLFISSFKRFILCSLAKTTRGKPFKELTMPDNSQFPKCAVSNITPLESSTILYLSSTFTSSIYLSMYFLFTFVSETISKNVCVKFLYTLFKSFLSSRGVFSFEKAADDVDDSVWRIARISPYAKIVGIKIACDAISSLSELDIGFYKVKDVGGTVIDKDCLKDGLDPSSGIATLTEEYAPDPANVGKEAYLIAGVTAANAKKYGAFDVCLTGNTAGADTGSISGILEYVE